MSGPGLKGQPGSRSLLAWPSCGSTCHLQDYMCQWEHTVPLQCWAGQEKAGASEHKFNLHVGSNSSALKVACKLHKYFFKEV